MEEIVRKESRSWRGYEKLSIKIIEIEVSRTLEKVGQVVREACVKNPEVRVATRISIKIIEIKVSMSLEKVDWIVRKKRT